MVKRVNPEYLSNKDDWEVIRLAEDDEVVGAVELRPARSSSASSPPTPGCCTSPRRVRPQGRAGGGMAGVRLGPGEQVVAFTAFTPGDDAVVVTVSGSSTALPGTEPGAVKVTPFSEYPAKGRATGGVRCHRFLKGEDTLVFAWAPRPGGAAAASGRRWTARGAGPARRLGLPGTQPIVACSSPVEALLPPAPRAT